MVVLPIRSNSRRANSSKASSRVPMGVLSDRPPLRREEHLKPAAHRRSNMGGLPLGGPLRGPPSADNRSARVTAPRVP